MPQFQRVVKQVASWPPSDEQSRSECRDRSFSYAGPAGGERHGKQHRQIDTRSSVLIDTAPACLRVAAKDEGIDDILGHGGGRTVGIPAASRSSHRRQPALRVVSGERGRRAPRPTPGDLHLAVAAHPGRPEVFTAWMDPSVTHENWTLRDHNPPPFDDEFQLRYRAAQRDPTSGSPTGPRSRWRP